MVEKRNGFERVEERRVRIGQEGGEIRGTTIRAKNCRETK